MISAPVYNTRESIVRILLFFGTLSSILYVAMFTLVPLLFEGYSITDHTVSELSALGAPTRPLWVALAALYVILFGLFGLGIVQSARYNRRLKTLGYTIILYSLFNIYWPPMHLRGNEPSITDTLHIVWAIVTVSLMIVIMVLGAMGPGKNFRLYTIISIVLVLLFGTLTSQNATNIPKDLPTPMMGIFERISIGLYMLWVAVLASRLRRDTSW